jgi:IS66 Orf2 like protein
VSLKLLPPGVKVHLAPGYVDMRKGIDGLSILVQGVVRQDPFSGHLFVFRAAPGPISSRSCSGMAPGWSFCPYSCPDSRTKREDSMPFGRNRRERNAPPERGLSTSSNSGHMLQRFRKVTAGTSNEPAQPAVAIG